MALVLRHAVAVVCAPSCELNVENHPQNSLFRPNTFSGTQSKTSRTCARTWQPCKESLKVRQLDLTAAPPPTTCLFRQYGGWLVAFAVLVNRFKPHKHVGGTFNEAVSGETTVMCSSTGCRLLLSHEERCVRVPAQKERQPAAVPDGPLPRSVLG